ncbi:MAG: ATP-binding cassette domain-containing protein, partial [Elusimicrobiota bacterium]
GAAAAPAAPFIEIRGLSKCFGAHWIIWNLYMSIGEGEIVVLRGPSGVGKSTFLRCLTYLEPFDEGNVRVGSLHLRPRMDERRDHRAIVAVRQQLGFVFQSFNLFPHLSVLDNITIGPVKALGRPAQEVRAEALALLRRIGLDHKAQAYPGSLSGGQQQRVGIARALAMRPKGILLTSPLQALTLP